MAPIGSRESYRGYTSCCINQVLSRVHFTGWLAYGEYRQVLQASAVQVYLTRPFVLSWSMLEAMATGCLVVGSGTPPVREFIQDGQNGLLVDFFSPKEIADRVEQVLDHPKEMSPLRQAARQTILDRVALRRVLPQHLEWLTQGSLTQN